MVTNLQHSIGIGNSTTPQKPRRSKTDAGPMITKATGAATL